MMQDRKMGQQAIKENQSFSLKNFGMGSAKPKALLTLKKDQITKGRKETKLPVKNIRDAIQKSDLVRIRSGSPGNRQ